MESKYLSTSKMANLLDINSKWLRQHCDDIFQEGIHFHRPLGFADCRWNVEAMIAWVEGSYNTSQDAAEILEAVCG